MMSATAAALQHTTWAHRPILQLNLWGRCVFGTCLITPFIICYYYWSITAAVCFLVLVALFGQRLAFVHHKYSENFREAVRKHRSDLGCPSNSVTPQFETRIEEELRQKCGIGPVEQSVSARGRWLRAITKIRGWAWGFEPPCEGNSSHLDMDHVHLDWKDFLMAYTMIVPSVILLQVSGMCRMTLRKWLHAKGMLSATPCDYEREVGRLCLESMQAVHFLCFTDEDKTIARFAWNNFETVDTRLQLSIASLFTVDINVKTRSMERAMLDNRPLAAPEVFILINFNTTAHSHPKVHALANWGVNPQITDPFVRWMSVVTVMYNYFGYTTFTQIIDIWRGLGLVRFDFSKTLDCFRLGLEEGIQPHGDIRKLMPHSSLVDFVVKIRNAFLNMFNSHKRDFATIDGEALFAGTVLHSLDHEMYVTNLRDVLWLDDCHPEFGFMAEVVQVTGAAFTADLPLLPFNCKFHQATHPFYQKVYEHARSIDPWFADRLDTCIIR